MTIASGATILASDIQAIKDDIDAVVSASGASNNSNDTTTGTSYGNLSGGASPSVTVTTGTTALVFISAEMVNSGANFCRMSFEVSGASSVSADDTRSIESHGTNELRLGTAVLLTSLTAGSNTFTAKYRVTGGTGTFDDRSIAVVPLGA